MLGFSIAPGESPPSTGKTNERYGMNEGRTNTGIWGPAVERTDGLAQEPRGNASNTYSINLRRVLDYEITQYPLREPPERSSSTRTPSKNWVEGCDCIGNVEDSSDGVNDAVVEDSGDAAKRKVSRLEKKSIVSLAALGVEQRDTMWPL